MAFSALRKLTLGGTRLGVMLALLVVSAPAQESLRHQIEVIAADAHGTVSVACLLPKSTLNCDLNPRGQPPMQSVFKLPLAMTVLHEVEQGKVSLNQIVRFLPADRILPSAYSPLQSKYPNGDVDVTMQELLRLAVALSDNVAADILLRILGGPGVVDGYIASIGIQGFHLQDGEKILHREVAAQYRNWFEPAGAVQLLSRIDSGRMLTAQHRELLLSWMAASVRGGRLGGDLPKGTPIFHKAGTSDVDNGVAHATNDIGLIGLPDGRRLAIAVFVTDSTADEATREQVIARIARCIYEASVGEKPGARVHAASLFLM